MRYTIITTILIYCTFYLHVVFNYFGLEIARKTFVVCVLLSFTWFLLSSVLIKIKLTNKQSWWLAWLGFIALFDTFKYIGVTKFEVILGIKEHWYELGITFFFLIYLIIKRKIKHPFERWLKKE